MLTSDVFLYCSVETESLTETEAHQFNQMSSSGSEVTNACCNASFDWGA